MFIYGKKILHTAALELRDVVACERRTPCARVRCTSACAGDLRERLMIVSCSTPQWYSESIDVTRRRHEARGNALLLQCAISDWTRSSAICDARNDGDDE